MKLTVYGSFNCPYSYLADLRAGRLTAAGAAELKWRAVVHDLAMPRSGLPVTGELAQMFDRELAQIRGLLKPGGGLPGPPTSTAAAHHARRGRILGGADG